MDSAKDAGGSRTSLPIRCQAVSAPQNRQRIPCRQTRQERIEGSDIKWLSDAEGLLLGAENRFFPAVFPHGREFRRRSFTAGAPPAAMSRAAAAKVSRAKAQTGYDLRRCRSSAGARGRLARRGSASAKAQE